ncbi:hypothetical protein LCL96_01435 [Rossellomorea aquimaris]|uniref:hypothetical protein n=1 Tax=Rossellomorea aquimaris TaxID=189382 RepID=UPI001CD43A36|nr:hypothetical protein [Rossellomorea aquimaris]MCA1057577.1 hypothetical protein [Rossellomorea aquimaris]
MKRLIIILMITAQFSLYTNVKANKNQKIDGAGKEELLEETLYSRYYPYLDKMYSDFIMCPRVVIERINGDKRRHIVRATALNYSAHHGDILYDRVHITLTDTPEEGVRIYKVSIEENISKKESILQCRKVRY